MQKSPLFNRIFLVVMDSVGIGAMPDADKFGDEGAHTLGHIAEHRAGLHMPHMQQLGLGNIERIQGISPIAHPLALYGKMAEASVGKDTMTGHWEIMGLRVDTPFRTFTETGFPEALIDQFEERVGRKVIGNIAASGTEIIKELGAQHMQTGDVIVYTSADSVFQIAAHEEVIPLAELYEMCAIAREITLHDPYMLGRVIARPFIGQPGSFIRTTNRKDYALKPFGRTVMNELQDAGFESIAIGKISDIFDGEGITQATKTISNEDGLDKLIASQQEKFQGLSFVNLVDFDALYGHRRDPDGYGQLLEAFDQRLPEVLRLLQEDDLLIIIADHGNDPTHKGTDHTREYVPLIMYSPSLRKGHNVGVRHTFADIGATIAHNFQIKAPEHGESLLNELSINLHK